MYMFKRFYLRSRGWRKDSKGWYKSFDPDVPSTSWRYSKSRYHCRDGITLQEAYEIACREDPHK